MKQGQKETIIARNVHILTDSGNTGTPMIWHDQVGMYGQSRHLQVRLTSSNKFLPLLVFLFTPNMAGTTTSKFHMVVQHMSLHVV